MADSPRYRSRSRSQSQSPFRMRSRGHPQSRSPSPIPRSRSKSRSRSLERSDASNPGNTLYVTGLSSRVTERDLKAHFSKEGKVADCFLVVEPRSRISRGFAFVTMYKVEDANRCIKYLNQSVLEGRYITVEKSKRKRARTPTPGNYLGLKNSRDTRDRYDRGGGGGYRGGYGREDYRGGYGREDYRGGYRRSPRHSPYRGGQEYSPRGPPYGGRERRGRPRSPPYSPYRSPDRGYSRRDVYAR